MFVRVREQMIVQNCMAGSRSDSGDCVIPDGGLGGVNYRAAGSRQTYIFGMSYLEREIVTDRSSYDDRRECFCCI